ncbi:MAG: hypothetical protein ACLFSY_10975 [Desulfonatronovibrionaceae bacterium]
MSEIRDNSAQSPSLLSALRRSSLSFLSLLPLLVGVIGLVGLFQVFVDPQLLAAFFQGNPVLDTLVGTLAGAFAAGNAVVSYIIGGELLAQEVSLYAVCAFILSWVSLGVVQIPAEIGVFGLRFVFIRNVLAFIFVILVSVATVFTVGMFA